MAEQKAQWRTLTVPMTIHVSAEADLIHDALFPILKSQLSEIMSVPTPLVYNQDLEANYTLVKEYILEMEWGRVEGARFRSMLTHLTKILKKSDSARLPRVDVLKRMWRLKVSDMSSPSDAAAPADDQDDHEEPDESLQEADKLAAVLKDLHEDPEPAKVPGSQADREPLIRCREAPPPDFMDASGTHKRYDHITAAQDVVRTRIREAAAAAEEGRIQKRKRTGGRRGFKITNGEQDAPAKEDRDDDDDGVEAHEPKPPVQKRNTRLNKLMKKGGEADKDAAPKAKAKASPKNSKARVSPKKAQAISKRLEKAQIIFETLKKEDLPGLQLPEEMKKQSFTVYMSGKKEKKGSSSTSGIQVILRAESFYVNQVLQEVPGFITMDGKGVAAAEKPSPGTRANGEIHLVDYMTEYLDRAGIKRSRDLEAVEMFCGVASIVKAFKKQGYDRGRDEVLEDLGNTQGFLRALALVLRLQPGGLLFAGLPCNTFGFMSQSVHCRSATSPFGANVPCVVVGNLLASRTCLLFLVALIRSACWALENPSQSKVPWFPYLKRFMGLPLFTHAQVFWWWPHLYYCY
ncbi:unnamed protein product [Symbiodinium sp. CCMP2592]|nr:unnamed protein product [Symbiodinium sp. CCMP2592]